MGFGCMVLCASIDPRACLSAQSLVSQRFISLCRVLWGPSKPRSLFLASPASFFFFFLFCGLLMEEHLCILGRGEQRSACEGSGGVFWAVLLYALSNLDAFL